MEIIGIIHVFFFVHMLSCAVQFMFWRFTLCVDMHKYTMLFHGSAIFYGCGFVNQCYADVTKLANCDCRPFARMADILTLLHAHWIQSITEKLTILFLPIFFTFSISFTSFIICCYYMAMYLLPLPWNFHSHLACTSS